MKVDKIILSDERRAKFHHALQKFVGKPAHEFAKKNKDELCDVAESIFTENEKTLLKSHVSCNSQPIVLIKNLPLPEIMPDSPEYGQRYNLDDTYVLDYAMHSIAFMIDVRPYIAASTVTHNFWKYRTTLVFHQDGDSTGPLPNHCLLAFMRGQPGYPTSFIYNNTWKGKILRVLSYTSKLSPLIPFEFIYRKLSTNIEGESGDMIVWNNRVVFHGVMKNVLSIKDKSKRRWAKHLQTYKNTES